ncbi:lytic murein transglycosylase [Psychromonas ingrahamii 37]|uniref:Lytic murein transglycosylase n=1 Tax=Psychromonas ingrahamii (strain DSM 17664 / CCUG 51855 / 37) TaxID=357804 RepID=A1STU9_PSYIN|nr:lytic murein transglycosylase [Psychromonas ingrahamii]ABM02914.1 lytic murein transglycosylase [Psychromonas ingrahamii 37]
MKSDKNFTLSSPMKMLFMTFFSSLLFSQLANAGKVNDNETLQKIPFAEYVEQIKIEAKENGIDPDVIENAFANVEFLQRSVKSDKEQPEFKLTLDTYIPRAVPEWKVKQARKAYQEHYQLLHEIGNAYGVQPRFIVALWGIETNFGRFTGNHYIISSLTTMAYEGRREALFKKQLFAALIILQQGHVDPEDFIGSWAGAMGQVQFMPTSYLNYAVDYDGDGKKDIWNTNADIFASAANYLKTEGWNNNETWGRQVLLPDNFDLQLSESKQKKSLQEWQDLGVRRYDGSALPKVDINASIVIPDDKDGRIYLAYNNYHVLMHWNRSYYFATAVSYLSERINEPRIVVTEK